MPVSTNQRQPSTTGKHHIIMVGSGGVGKSALVQRLLNGSFSDDYCPTRVDSFSKLMLVDGEKCWVGVLDTAGQETFTAMRDNYYRGGEGFFCVYSIADRQSFETVKELHEHICRVTDRDDAPFLLVANKVDLEPRLVSEEEGRALAESWGPSCTYMETSAKEGIEVGEAFEVLTRKIIEDKEARGIRTSRRPEPVKRCCVIG